MRWVHPDVCKSGSVILVRVLVQNPPTIHLTPWLLDLPPLPLPPTPPPYIYRERERQRQRDRDRDRQRQKDRDSETERREENTLLHKGKDLSTLRLFVAVSERERETETDRQTDRQTESETQRERKKSQLFPPLNEIRVSLQQLNARCFQFFFSIVGMG